MTKTTPNYFLYLSIIWILCIIIINPIGDFPLNDDWSYAHNAKALALENKIVFHDWGAMTLIVHTIWGALFCKLFGFSFTVLRASTLVLGWGTLLVTFLYFKEGGMKKKYAFWGTLLFAINPFFLENAFTYMTEIPFLFFFLSAALFFQKSINGKNGFNLIYATLFSILATLIRQPGVLIPVAFFFIHIIKNKPSLKTVIQAVTPAISTLLSLTLFVKWRATNFGLSENFGQAKQLINNITRGKFVSSLQHISYGDFTLWGLFLIPLLVVLVPYFWKNITHTKKIIFIVITLLFCYPFIIIPDKVFLGNTFFNLGMGPIVLPSSSNFSPPQIGENDWKNLYTIGFVAGIFLVKWIFIKTYQLFIFIKNKNENTVNWGSLFALTTAFGYFLFLMLNTYFFDRYSIIAFPFFILLLIPPHTNFDIPNFFKILGIACFAIISIFSISATHDYLSWNRARWDATNYALDELKIPYDQLSGGFEYKKMYNFTSYGPTDWEDMEYWNTSKEQYKLAFSPQCKYNVIKPVPYFRYLPPKQDTMYLLKKEHLSRIDTIFCDVENITDEGKQLFSNHENILLKNAEQRTTNKARSGKYSILSNRSHQYAFTFKLKNAEPCEKIWVSVWRSPSSVYGNAVLVYGHYFFIPSEFKRVAMEGDWGKSTQEFTVPADF
ncbi:MAG TPA: hypothetical protein ENJ53_03375, partial [Phaeodactylibacter sp.]|nr:hypothetical protein [Phaeodactylibacter sp.]